MIANYAPSERKKGFYYELAFDDGRNNGFGFPCDENGNLLDMPDAAKENYEYCLSHPEKFKRFNKVVKYGETYIENASGTCKCGNRIELVNEYMGACQCPHCGQWYNLFGQEIEPPENWKEETEEDY